MPQINCYIPIKLRLTGRPSDDQLDELSETLVRALEARIALAEETIRSRNGNRWSNDSFELVQERYDLSREDVAADGYAMPSYQEQGGLQIVRWRRRRIPRRLKAGILSRGRVRLPTKNVEWLLWGKRPDWLTISLSQLIEIVPEVDVTIELFRRRPGLHDFELTNVFNSYLDQRHSNTLSDTPHYAFRWIGLDRKRSLELALQMNLDTLIKRGGIPVPHRMSSSEFRRHVLLIYASFPATFAKDISYEAEVIITASRPAPEEALAHLERPEELIARYTTYRFPVIRIDIEALGKYLLSLIKRSFAYSRYVQKVLDELGSGLRDNLSLAFAENASDDDLLALASSIDGRVLLERLYAELVEGSVGGAEQQQAQRILRARTQVRPAEEAVEGVAGKRLLFPFRLAGAFWGNDAPLDAARSRPGRIRVKIPIRVRHNYVFKAETETLPLKVFTEGYELDVDEWISIKLYDEGGIIISRPALYLLTLANQSFVRTWENIGTTVAVVSSFGLGGTGAAAAKGAQGVTWGARTLQVLNYTATTLSVASWVVREQRGWLIATFGEKGRKFANTMEIVGSFADIYGLGRLVLEAPRLIIRLRGNWRDWRTSSTFQHLDGDDLRRAEDISQKTEQFLNSADEAAAAAGREGVPTGSGASRAAVLPSPGAAAGAAEGSSRVILYRGTAYRFVRGRSRQVHDLGDGVYMTLDPELGVRYAQIRRVEVQAVEPGAPGIVLRVEAEPDELGTVLDFYNNRTLRTEWETYLSRQPGGEVVLRGGPAEMYNAHFENWLRTKGLSLEQFDVIIGPEYIRGGSQVCIRNEGIADRLLRRAEEWARAHEPLTPAYPEVPASRLPSE